MQILFDREQLSVFVASERHVTVP